MLKQLLEPVNFEQGLGIISCDATGDASLTHLRWMLIQVQEDKFKELLSPELEQVPSQCTYVEVITHVIS